MPQTRPTRSQSVMSSSLASRPRSRRRRTSPSASLSAAMSASLLRSSTFTLLSDAAWPGPTCTRRITRTRAYTRPTPGAPSGAPSLLLRRSLMHGGEVKVCGASFAQSTHAAARGWSPACALAAGIKDAERDLLTTFVLSAFRFIPHELLRRRRARRTSQHHSSGSSCGGNSATAQLLLLKGNVCRTLTAFTPDIAAARAGSPRLGARREQLSCAFPARSARGG
jgi:hypothetical protein